MSGFLLIFFSEIGDKTFFIALLLALKQPKGLVFTGTFGALAVMTVVSVLLGQVRGLPRGVRPNCSTTEGLYGKVLCGQGTVRCGKPDGRSCCWTLAGHQLLHVAAMAEGARAEGQLPCSDVHTGTRSYPSPNGGQDRGWTTGCLCGWA